MRDTFPSFLPPKAGAGYKPQHFASIVAGAGPVEWLEIHAENYTGDSGRPLAQLRHLAEHFPISVHGVALSIGGKSPLDKDHLAWLKTLCDWLQPASFSKHLTWSTHDGAYLNDLLAMPYNAATVARVAAHVIQVQDVVGRRLLLENPSSYLTFTETEMSEIDFLTEVARQSGCGLLLDVNNVFVSATNLGFAPLAFLDAFPLDIVGEIHLGGHDVDSDEGGEVLLIDSNGQAVTGPVWALYAAVIAKGGPKPTLIEWDNNVPSWQVLASKAARADAILVPAR